MRVVFLDVDGVLNQQASAGTEGNYALDRRCVEGLNRIVAATHCIVVISSLWRRYLPLWHIHSLMVEHGYLYGVHDRTQVHWRQDRGKDVEDYLSMCADAGIEVGSFVAIDDTPMSIDEKRMVMTDTSKGLTSGDVERAIAILRGE